MPASPRPRIGISLSIGTPDECRKVYQINSDYPESVLRAGGLPVLLPHTRDAALRLEMLAWLDGLIIPGGDDIDPALYGQPKHEKTKLINKDRENFDLALLARAEQCGLPTLGICLGCQLMNVQRRGTLHQHLPDQQGPVQHARAGDHTNFHAVTIQPGTSLALAVGVETLETNSRHHQGIARLGHGLRISATAPDGLIEAFEDPSLPFWLAVQWHPENLGGTRHDGLFAALIKASQSRASAR